MNLPNAHLLPMLCGRPQAQASITGSGSFPSISGWVRFYQINEGVIVYAEVSGLPKSDQPCQERLVGFHIHQGTDCGGSGDGPFPNAMSHYDPKDRKHPCHAGDLPALFGNDGLAVSAFLTDRFFVEDIIGKVVILHDRPDDFTTQPSGNSGTKIACGVIQRTPGFCG